MAKETQKAKIERLENEIEQLRYENKKYLNDLTDLHNQLSAKSGEVMDSDLYRKLLKERDSYLEAIKIAQKSRRESDERFRKVIEQLQNEIQKLNNETDHNVRNAGRKPKLSDEQITQVIFDRQTNHLTINALSKKYKCSVGAIHKIISTIN